jgi:hypothetical protein
LRTAKKTEKLLLFLERKGKGMATTVLGLKRKEEKGMAVPEIEERGP